MKTNKRFAFYIKMGIHYKNMNQNHTGLTCPQQAKAKKGKLVF